MNSSVIIILIVVNVCNGSFILLYCIFIATPVVNNLTTMLMRHNVTIMVSLARSLILF